MIPEKKKEGLLEQGTLKPSRDLSGYLSICPSRCRSIYPSVYLSVDLSSICLSVGRSIHPSVYLSASNLSADLSV